MTRIPNPRPATPAPTELRRQILDDFQAMRIPLRPEQLDAVLGRAESEGMSHLEFLRALINEQANGRRERALANRIRAAGFAQIKTLADFDWQFNAEVIDRVRIETLAGGEFIGRRQNLGWVGQSGVGKSHLIQAIGRCACVLGYRVRYETSASILQSLTAALADHTLPRLLRYYAKFDLVILDEFGFDRVLSIAGRPLPRRGQRRRRGQNTQHRRHQESPFHKVVLTADSSDPCSPSPLIPRPPPL
jgi:DNA replication protein DnaC